MDSIVFQYRTDSLDTLAAAVMTAFHMGSERVVLDLDLLEKLDSSGVRGLITLLRRSREIGGEIALRTDRPDIIRALRVMALDRLFPVLPAVAA